MIPKESTVLIARGATMGRSCLLGEDMAINQTCYALVPDREKVGPYFLFYSIKLLDSFFQKIAHGAIFNTVIGSGLRETDINLPPSPPNAALPVFFPPWMTKSNSTSQTNATLEAIAQAIFKEWFVNFNFPPTSTGSVGEAANQGPLPELVEGKGPMHESELGPIPVGWRVLPLDEIAEFLNGLALQKYSAENDQDYLPVIKIRELRNGITNSTDRANKNIPSNYIIKDGDLLFSWSGSLEVKFWVGGEGALNQHLFKASSTDYPSWFCYFWLLYHLNEFRNIAADKATTMGHIKRGHLSETLCLIPDSLERMNEIVGPIIEQLINNEKEIITLAQIRDALLPKLMRGEIEV
jgi:type I restriction enzyme S subunit